MTSTFSADALRQYQRDITEHITHLRKADAPIEKKSQQDLVETYLPLVIRVAWGYYRNTGGDLMDLIQEGNLGLLRAATKFDPSMGVQFSTYAVYWIKAAILSTLPQRIVSLSASKSTFERLQRLLHTQREMREAGQEPNLAQLAKEMEASVATVLALLNLQQGMYTASLDAQTGEHEEDTLANLLEEKPEHAPESVAFLKARNEHIQRLVKLLTKAEREVILLRYGLRDGEAHTYDDMATCTHFGIDKIHSLEYRALLKMRRLAMHTQLQDFVDD